MPRVLLATQNARWTHPAMGLRYLQASLRPEIATCEIREFTPEDRPAEMAEVLLAARPDLVGLGLAVWNVAALGQVASLLRLARPDLPLVVGGPEVADPDDLPAAAAFADCAVCGEGEEVLPDVCGRLLRGERQARVVRAPDVVLRDLPLPYEGLSDEDLLHRTLYVEASRGCPSRCAFCTSAEGPGLRLHPMERVLGVLSRLWDRGARRFKFLDRSLLAATASPVLGFFLDRVEPGMFLHFEATPGRLPHGLVDLVARFPPGVVQLELGIQTWDPDVSRTIGRPQDPAAVEADLVALRERTGAHLHADLLLGLPGEGVEAFGAGFDRLHRLRPQEIQVGVLKRLRGTPLARHAATWGLTFDPAPPYEVVRTEALDFLAIQRLKRFAHLWDRLANRGAFPRGTAAVLEGRSPFATFLDFADWLHVRDGRCHGLGLPRLGEGLIQWATARGLDTDRLGALLRQDWADVDPRHVPGFLQAFPPPPAAGGGGDATRLPPRQRRHLRPAGDA